MVPFYDSNSGIKKVKYYKNLIKYLKRIRDSKNIEQQFDVIEIKGALPSLDLEHESGDNEDSKDSEDDDDAGGPLSASLPGTTKLNLEDQIILLRCAPEVSRNLSVNKFAKVNLKKSEVAEKQLSIFSTLMSTCYKSIQKVNVSTYYSEVSRRILLRFLCEFEQAYNYLKEWVSEYAPRERGIRTASQVHALLTGKSAPKDLLNIKDQRLEVFQIQHYEEKKRKRGQTENLDLAINIPGFLGNISSRKLHTFIAAGPRLMKLLHALNDNWVLLDIVDDITITWLENFCNDEWDAFIKEISLA
jgi:hypothetical protein